MATYTFIGALNCPSMMIDNQFYSGYFYATIAEGNLYMARYFNSAPWDAATNDEKFRALSQATQMIDSLNLVGTKTDILQYLEFPRFDSEEVPLEIKQACILIANALLEGIDPDKEYSELYITSQRFDVVATSYDRKSLPEWILAGIPSLAAWRLLRPYIKNVESFRVNRVS